MSNLLDHLVLQPMQSGLILLLVYVILAFLIYRLIAKPWMSALLCAIPLLLVSLGISFYHHHDVRVGWVEKRGNASVSVHYSLFNGIYEIPIQARKGQTLHVHHLASGGDWFYVRQPDNQNASMIDDVGGDASYFDVKITQTGPYTIVQQADHYQDGMFEYSWKLADK